MCTTYKFKDYESDPKPEHQIARHFITNKRFENTQSKHYLSYLTRHDVDMLHTAGHRR